MIIALLYAILIVAYSIFLLKLYFSWKNIKSNNTEKPGKVSVTVLIPVKNEAEHIELLLSDIDNQNFDEDFEAIVINDHSSDKTLKLCNSFSMDHHSLRILSLPSGKEGKKAAIEYGVKHAKHEVILTTDGDCRLGREWVKSISRAFRREVNLISGPVKYRSTSKGFSKLLNMEFASLIGVGGAMLNSGIPGMCNGANLAFRKNIFHKVGGYSDNKDFPTGDDEFLLRKVWKEEPGSAIFLKDRKSIVSTKPPENLGVFFQQRKRWSSKWKRHKEFYSIAPGIFIFLVYLLQLSGFFHLLINPLSSWNTLFLCFVAIKILIDQYFMKSVLSFLVEPFSNRYFLFLQLIYPFYSLIFGLVANFGSYSWKGRTYKI
ncbi:MAG: glycosyltransferase [Bacteroidota bacterium]